jgi:hypothetical protein
VPESKDAQQKLTQKLVGESIDEKIKLPTTKAPGEPQAPPKIEPKGIWDSKLHIHRFNFSA